MRIVLVRHGKPDYATDSLTELGKLQAEATAPRLMREGISEIYSSTMGRALGTAEPFSKISGLPINRLEFIREIRWGSNDGTELPKNGHPWLFMPDYISEGGRISDTEWRERDAFVKNTRLIEANKRVADGADEWLRLMGYEREGDYYRVKAPTDKTVVIFCHHGAMTNFISHLLNIPTPLAMVTICPYFCSVSVIAINGDEGALVTPKIELLADSYHVPKDDGDFIQKVKDKE